MCCALACSCTSSRLQTIVPRVFQLEAILATLNGRDSIITAGTGCGKTLCLIIPNLLRPDTISVTISPLKRLQITQVNACMKYGISTISINEDTPNGLSSACDNFAKYRCIFVYDRGKSCFDIAGKEEFRSNGIELDMEALFDLVHFTVHSITDM
ncbi:hypothetical protein F4604DRAFT_1640580 [Suillus subluteus]|nr:hypothetical protein F4604DRAFT_1640580 [Suillus subluteus]